MLLGLYSIGFVVAISTGTYVAHLLHVPYWIVICAVVLLGQAW